MAEKNEIKSMSKIRSWLKIFVLTCIFAIVLCWSIFGIWSYIYPEKINYSFKANKNSTSSLSLSGKGDTYFVTLPVQQIQLIKQKFPAYTMEVQLAFAVKKSSDETEIAAKLPLIQDMLITYLRATTIEELQENSRLFYLKEALLERINTLLFPTRIQDILFQKIIIREGI